MCVTELRGGISWLKGPSAIVCCFSGLDILDWMTLVLVRFHEMEAEWPLFVIPAIYFHSTTTRGSFHALDGCLPHPSWAALSPFINISPVPMVTWMGLSFLPLFPEFPPVPSAGLKLYLLAPRKSIWLSCSCVTPVHDVAGAWRVEMLLPAGAHSRCCRMEEQGQPMRRRHNKECGMDLARSQAGL